MCRKSVPDEEKLATTQVSFELCKKTYSLFRIQSSRNSTYHEPRFLAAGRCDDDPNHGEFLP